MMEVGTGYFERKGKKHESKKEVDGLLSRLGNPRVSRREEGDEGCT